MSRGHVTIEGRQQASDASLHEALRLEPAAIVIGASAGAVGALQVLLPSLPRTLQAPVLVVVHVPPKRRSALVGVFSDRCSLVVKEAEDKEPLRSGVVYFAPPDHHLLVEREFSIALSRDDTVRYSRPSIDVLFTSAADAYGDGLLGIILTGANSDGAEGLRSVVDAGGTGLVQDPQSAEAAAMPEAAIKACPEALVLPLRGMAEALAQIGRMK